MAQKYQGWGTKIKKSQSSFENFFWEHIISSMGHIILPKYTSGTEYTGLAPFQVGPLHSSDQKSQVEEIHYCS